MSTKPNPNEVTSAMIRDVARRLREVASSLEFAAEKLDENQIDKLATTNWKSSGEQGTTLTERAVKSLSTAIFEWEKGQRDLQSVMHGKGVLKATAKTHQKPKQ